jgi:hypothetical protein
MLYDFYLIFTVIQHFVTCDIFVQTLMNQILKWNIINSLFYFINKSLLRAGLLKTQAAESHGNEYKKYFTLYMHFILKISYSTNLNMTLKHHTMWYKVSTTTNVPGVTKPYYLNHNFVINSILVTLYIEENKIKVDFASYFWKSFILYFSTSTSGFGSVFSSQSSMSWWWHFMWTDIKWSQSLLSLVLTKLNNSIYWLIIHQPAQGKDRYWTGFIWSMTIAQG